jgi:hypothetical protein
VLFSLFAFFVTPPFKLSTAEIPIDKKLKALQDSVEALNPLRPILPEPMLDVLRQLALAPQPRVDGTGRTEKTREEKTGEEKAREDER